MSSTRRRTNTVLIDSSWNLKGRKGCVHLHVEVQSVLQLLQDLDETCVCVCVSPISAILHLPRKPETEGDEARVANINSPGPEGSARGHLSPPASSVGTADGCNMSGGVLARGFFSHRGLRSILGGGGGGGGGVIGRGETTQRGREREQKTHAEGRSQRSLPPFASATAVSYVR